MAKLNQLTHPLWSMMIAMSLGNYMPILTRLIFQLTVGVPIVEPHPLPCDTHPVTCGPSYTNRASDIYIFIYLYMCICV